MKTGKITIKDEQNDGNYVVHVQFINGNLWITDNEIARLFNVHISTIRKNIIDIFKAKLLFEESETKENHLTNDNGKILISKLYSFEVLLFLAYRIDTFEVRAFRVWVQNSLKREREDNIIIIPFGSEMLN